LRKRGTPGGAKIFGGGENGRKQGRRAVREWGERQRPRERQLFFFREKGEDERKETTGYF